MRELLVLEILHQLMCGLSHYLQGCLGFLPSTVAPENVWLEGKPFLLGRPIFRGYVSFREGTLPKKKKKLQGTITYPTLGKGTSSLEWLIREIFAHSPSFRFRNFIMIVIWKLNNTVSSRNFISFFMRIINQNGEPRRLFRYLEILKSRTLDLFRVVPLSFDFLIFTSLPSLFEIICIHKPWTSTIIKIMGFPQFRWLKIKTRRVQQWWLYKSTHCFFMVVGILG